MKNEIETYREWMALRFYGELGENEQRELDAFLAASPEGRRLEQELRATLGPVAALAQHASEPGMPDAPESWFAELEAAAERDRPRARLFRLLLPAAAGFAAGVLATWSWTASPPRTHDAPTEVATEASPFTSASPPPPATGQVGLTRFRRFLPR